MDKREDLLLRLNTIAQNNESLYKGLEDVSVRFNRMAAAAEQADTVIDDIQEQFLSTTKLKTIDVGFLFTAVALQVVRQYLLTPMTKRMGNQESGDKVKDTKPVKWLGMNEEHSNRRHRYYNPSLEEIITNPVPYDANCGADGALKGGGHLGHRSMTLGHDPILGWIFGTANILTDCITFNNFHTNRISRIDPVTGAKKMVITPEVVLLGKMFSECYDEVKADPLNLPAALFAQAQHLKSDEFTKLGLPVPILSSINEDFASKLYSENYDALCFARDAKIVGASFVVSKLFDMIISLLHGLFRKDGEDKDLYEVRSRKILLISNAIASSSTIINATITSNPKNLDIGSLLNTMTHLFTDVRFILRIKQEFIESEIAERVQKEISAVDALYEAI